MVVVKSPKGDKERVNCVDPETGKRRIGILDLLRRIIKFSDKREYQDKDVKYERFDKPNS